MAPKLLFDISQIDMDQVVYDAGEIEAINPHRGCMRLLDGIIYHKPDVPAEVVAYRDIGADEFWVPGHIPGRPLFPGVLIIEASAQLASFVSLKRLNEKFLGFTKLENVRFRGQVVPGDRLILLGKEVNITRRRGICNMQALVNGQLVYEGQVTGMVF